MKITRRHAIAVSLAAICASAALSVVSTPAGAATIETGALQIHGPGSVFSGSHTFASASALAGTVTTFTVNAVNTGSVAGQFNLRVGKADGAANTSTVAVTASGVNITAQATGTDGYFTPPIAAHKLVAYLVKVTSPKTAPLTSRFFTSVVLSDVKGVKLDSVVAESLVRATVGTTAYDLFVSGSGQNPLLANGLYNSITNPGINAGGTTSFTVKVQNDAVGSTTIGVHLVDGANCAAYFVPTVKVGTVNVTAAVLADTYQTPLLAHAKSTSLVVSIKYASIPPGLTCTDPSDVWTVTSHDAFANSEVANLIVNPSVAAASSSYASPDSNTARLSGITGEDNPYVATCGAGDECDSPQLSAQDGSATFTIESDPSAGSQTITAFLGGSGNPCTGAATAAPANFFVTSTDNTKYVTYTTYGDYADAAYAAGGGTGDDHVCYDSPNDFLAYYPTGAWSGTTDGDTSNFGMVPLDPITGDYVGLLANCSVTSGQEPCIDGSGGIFDLVSPVHSYDVMILAPAGDPRITN